MSKKSVKYLGSIGKTSELSSMKYTHRGMSIKVNYIHGAIPTPLVQVFIDNPLTGESVEVFVKRLKDVEKRVNEIIDKKEATDE